MKDNDEYDEMAGPEMSRAAKQMEEMQQEQQEEGDDEEDDSFLQISANGPEVGTIGHDGNVIKCKGQAAKDAKSFKKSELCRNHGNGLEVVCVEKYYQEASADLPKPDLVVMFSPGFPQLGRRSWDQVLRPLLDSTVPIMVNDIFNSGEKVKNVYDTTGKTIPAPGSKWADMTGLG